MSALDRDDGLRVPCDVVAEQSVLGALLQDNSAMQRALPLSPAHFFDSRCRQTFAAIAALLERGDPADQVTTLAQLRSVGQADAETADHLAALVICVPSSSSVGAYASIVRDHAGRRELLAAADRIRTVALEAPAGEAHARAQTILQALQGGAARPSFALVDMSQLPHETAEIPWPWSPYIPPGNVTLLGGHGGAGKSTFAAHLSACMAVGAPAFGHATTRCQVLYFTGEDPAPLVLSRLRRICQRLDLSFDEVQESLRIVDATDSPDFPEADAVLFTERRVDGVRVGVTTSSYDELAAYIERERFGLVVIDNASDTYDADEISRAMVRRFVRSLAKLVRPWHGAVLLLAHVDKATSRAGVNAGSESYSGTTAWHNSVRSRLFLLEHEPGELELQHLKSNLGPKQPAMRLEWPQGDVMKALAVGGFVASIEARTDTRALLGLVHEFGGRGEHVAAGTTSPRNAARLLSKEAGYPKHLKPAEVFALLRDAEREKLLRKEAYKDANRKSHERWALTDKGIEFTSAAPTAPTAPT